MVVFFNRLSIVLRYARKIFGGFLIAHLSFSLIPNTFANNFYMAAALLMAGVVYFDRFGRRDVTMGLWSLRLFADNSNILFNLLYGASLAMACDDAIPKEGERFLTAAFAAIFGFISRLAIPFLFDMPI
jgi:hypothetical protein